MFKRIAEPGRLIISLALILSSLLLILTDHAALGGALLGGVASAWGIRTANGFKYGKG